MMPDELTEDARAELKAAAANLRRVAGFIDGYVRADEDNPAVLAAGAAQLMHIAAGLVGADDSTAVSVKFGNSHASASGDAQATG